MIPAFQVGPDDFLNLGRTSEQADEKDVAFADVRPHGAYRRTTSGRSPILSPRTASSRVSARQGSSPKMPMTRGARGVNERARQGHSTTFARN